MRDKLTELAHRLLAESGSTQDGQQKLYPEGMTELLKHYLRIREILAGESEKAAATVRINPETGKEIWHGVLLDND